VARRAKLVDFLVWGHPTAEAEHEACPVIFSMLSNDAGGSAMHSNLDRRVIIWPVYIDQQKSVAEGRKIPQRYCVEYPQMSDLKDVLAHLGFDHAYEDSKAYSRDLTQYGRFRVTLRDPVTGQPKVEGITTRRALLQAVCEHIPKLKSRADGKAKGPSTVGLPLPGYPDTLLPVTVGPGGQPAGYGAIGGNGNPSAGGGSSKKKKASR